MFRKLSDRGAFGRPKKYRSAVNAGLLNFGNDENTKALLHFNVSPFVDSAVGNETPLTISNTDVSLDTTNKKFGAGSGDFNGSSSFITFSLSSLPNLFLVSFRMRFNSVSSETQFFSMAPSGTLRMDISSTAYFRLLGSTSTTSAFKATADTWYHIGMLKYDTSSAALFINGTLIGTVTGAASTGITLGKEGGGTRFYLDGNIDEFRVQETTLTSAPSTIEVPTKEYAP